MGYSHRPREHCYSCLHCHQRFSYYQIDPDLRKYKNLNMEEAKEACILHIKLNHSSKNLSCECGKYFQYQCGFCRHSCPINNNKKRIVKSAFDEFNNKNDDTYDEAMEYIQKLKEIRYNRMLVDFMRDHGRF